MTSHTPEIAGSNLKNTKKTLTKPLAIAGGIFIPSHEEVIRYLALDTALKGLFFIITIGSPASLKQQDGGSWRPPKTPSRERET